jgi:hypothetical protein
MQDPPFNTNSCNVRLGSCGMGFRFMLRLPGSYEIVPNCLKVLVCGVQSTLTFSLYISIGGFISFY